MSSIVDISALAAGLQNFIADTSNIGIEALMDLDSTEHVTVMEVTNKTPLTRIRGNDFLQPSVSDGSWNPQGTFTPDVRYVDPRGNGAGKIDIEFVPQALWPTFLAYQRKAGSADATALTFEEWLIQNYILQAVKDGLEMETIWQGIRDVEEVGAVNITHGYLKHIALEIAASNITPVAGAVITASNALDQVELVWRNVPARLKRRAMKCFVSQEVFEFYCLDYRNSVGAIPYNDQFTKRFIDGSQCEIVPRPGMGDSQRIIIVPENDIVLAFDSSDDLNKITIEKEKRKINIMMDFAIDVEFADIANVTVNDQA